MTTTAIVMMLFSMFVIWGGLIYWTWSLRFRPVPALDPEVEEFISTVESLGEEAVKASRPERNN